jgi:RNA polymerase-binding transcription factor DksA
VWARLEDDRAHTETLVSQLAGEIASLTAQRRLSPTDDEHDPEGPTLAFERSQSSAALVHSRNRIDQIGHAIERIDAGTFGRCAECGSQIPFARLEARPFSPYCVRCAEGHTA